MGQARCQSRRVVRGAVGAPAAVSALASLALAAAVTSPVRALAAPGDAGPAVDVIDLPPLQEPTTSGEVDLQTLLAAAAAGEDLVTGVAKREQTLGNVASAVTVVSGDRLRRMGARTVGDAIATAAGIYLVDDRLSTRVGIRGLQPAGDFNTRILVIIDGTTVTESWSHLSGVGYDLPVSIDEIERIEVIRGPVSSIYGTNAFFGIINIITRGPSADGRAWARASVGQIGGASLSAGFAMGTVDEQIRGSMSATMRRGEESTYGEESRDRDRDAGEQVQFSLSGAYRGTFAQVRGYLYDRTIPFAPYESAFSNPYKQTNQQIIADIGHVVEVGGVRLGGRLFGNFYRFDDVATSSCLDISVECPLDENGRETIDPSLITIGEARTVGVELRGRYQLHELVGATAGLEATYNYTTSDFHDEGKPDQYAGNMEFGLAGFYVEADAAPRPWLGFTGGLRIDKQLELGTPPDGDTPPVLNAVEDPTEQTGISPRLAAFFSHDDRYGVKLLYAAGFRYPNTYERRFNDRQDFIGNKELDPERIYSGEMVGWARPTATTWLRASLFYWRAEDVIKQKGVWIDGEGNVVEVEDPDSPPPGVSPRLQFDNEDAYTSFGLELEASYRDRNGWLAFAGASLVRARVEMTEVEMVNDEEALRKIVVENRPPGSPAWTISAGASSPKLANLFHLSSELTLLGARPTIECTEGCNDESANGRTRASHAKVFIGWNAAIYAPSLYGFDVTIGMRNILGKAQQVVAAEDFNREGETADFVSGEGRELYVRIGHVLP